MFLLPFTSSIDGNAGGVRFAYMTVRFVLPVFAVVSVCVTVNVLFAVFTVSILYSRAANVPIADEVPMYCPATKNGCAALNNAGFDTVNVTVFDPAVWETLDEM